MGKVLFILICLFSLKAIAQTDEILLLKNQLATARTIKEKFGVIYRLCEYYGSKGNADSMRIQSSHLLDIAMKEKDDSLLIRAYIQVNSFYWVIGDFPLSIEYSFKAINLAEKTGNYRVCAGASSNVAWAYMNLRNFPKARELCLTAIDYAKKLKKEEQDLFFMMAYGNLAEAYFELGKTDSALHYTQLANSISIKEKDLYAQTGILTTFGRIYETLNDHELAETYYRKAINLATSISIEEHASISIACIHYCRLLLKLNKIDEAKHYAIIAVQEAFAAKGKRQIVESSEILQLVYERQDRTDSAYHYSKVANVYRDSAFNEQKSLQVQNVTFSQQLYENERRLQAEEEAVARKHNLQYAAIGIGLISFIIVFLLFSYSIIANQKLIRFLGAMALLLVFELINLYLHPHIGNFTHHSPLFMLLIMVCVAALLVPLHHRLEHWLTRRMVEKNNKIRLAAARKTIAKLEEEVNVASAEKSTNAQQRL